MKDKPRILFVCSANKDRSKTAEDHFSEQFSGMEFSSAGTNLKICDQLGTNPLSEELLDWADHIFVMETKHHSWIKTNFRNKYRITVLHIEDIYKYGQPQLIHVLELKVRSTIETF